MFRATQLISKWNANKCNKYSKDKSDIKVLYLLFQFKGLMRQKPLLVEYRTRGPFLSLDLIFFSMSINFRYAIVTRVVFSCIFAEISHPKRERVLHLAYLCVQQ